MKLITIAILSFAFAWLLCYGAMRTAEKIVRAEHETSSLVEEP